MSTLAPIAGALDEAAGHDPDRPLILADDRSYTYAEVVAWSERLAAGLVALGVEVGDHVAMIVANYPEFLAVKFAVARAGAVCVPVNYLFRRDELGYVLGQSDATVLITMDRFRDLDYAGALDSLAPGWESGGGGDRFPTLREVSSVSAVFSSGGQSPVRIWQALLDTFGAEEVFTAYGMTETTASTTCTRPDDPLAVEPASGAAAAFDPDGWFKTGDLGRVDPDGTVTLTGRLKEMYKCGGELVVPKQVEDVLTAHPAVAQAHLVGIPDERMGEVGCACIVLAPPGGSVAAAELIAWCAERLARFKVPRHVLFIDAAELPTSATGKIQKFLLVKWAQDGLGERR